tara:strand:- start:386 stop:637 length:252 start_codon:yes stop_codon:yes gene_type:complete
MSDLLVFEDLKHYPTNTYLKLSTHNSLIHVIGTDTKIFENNKVTKNIGDNTPNNKLPKENKPNKLSKKNKSNDNLFDFFLTKF